MRHLLQAHRCWSGVDERLCVFTQEAEIEVLDAAWSRTFQVWSLQDGLLHSIFHTWSLCNHGRFRGARKTDAVGTFQVLEILRAKCCEKAAQVT